MLTPTWLAAWGKDYALQFVVESKNKPSPPKLFYKQQDQSLHLNKYRYKPIILKVLDRLSLTSSHSFP